MPSVTRVCSIEGCERTGKLSLGMCGLHYQRLKKHGDPTRTLIKYHGLNTNSPEYRTWVEVRRRCEDPKRPNYPDYGGRGITVCERWHEYPEFLADMGPRPENTSNREWQIERINNSKGYEPGNCIWATVKTQANNRRSNHFLTAFGKTKTIQEWCDEYDIPDTTFHNRLRRGWSVEKALTTPRMTQFSNSIPIDKLTNWWRSKPQI